MSKRFPIEIVALFAGLVIGILLVISVVAKLITILGSDTVRLGLVSILSICLMFYVKDRSFSEMFVIALGLPVYVLCVWLISRYTNWTVALAALAIAFLIPAALTAGDFFDTQQRKKLTQVNKENPGGYFSPDLRKSPELPAWADELYGQLVPSPHPTEEVIQFEELPDASEKQQSGSVRHPVKTTPSPSVPELYDTLMSYLADPSVTRAMAFDTGSVLVERNGTLEQVSSQHGYFTLLRDTAIKLLGKDTYKEAASQLVWEGQLDDGTAVALTTDPENDTKAALTLIKPPRYPTAMSELVDIGFLNAEIASLLSSALAARQNILICGGVHTEKQTLLAALINDIAQEQHVVILEDTSAGLQVGPNVVRLNRPAMTERAGGAETMGAIALAMTPAWIVFTAMDGQDLVNLSGSNRRDSTRFIGTILARDAKDALFRLEASALKAGMSLADIREQLSLLVDLIVDVNRPQHGEQTVMRVTKVQSHDGTDYVLTSVT